MRATKRKAAAFGGAVAALAAVLALVYQLDSHDTAPGNGAAAGSAGSPRSEAAGPAGQGARKGGDKPAWRALSPAQQRALQPLQVEWDGMDGVRKQKWLQLAARFDSMKPDDQQRMHERMRAWVKLTPQQRELARETYSRARKITPDQKTASWENYLQLPDEQKRKLAASATTRQAPGVVPSQANAKVVTPLGQGASACPAGTVRNSLSATPPCVGAPASSAPPVAPPAAAPAATPPLPAPPSQPEKPVPANWGITPNNA